MATFWGEALAELREGRSVYVMIVAEAKKGSPGTDVARMFVREDGTQCGTIGGGIMEKNALDTALEVMRGRGSLSPCFVELEHKSTDPDKRSGLICGGGQSNLHFILSPTKHLTLVAQIAEAEEGELEKVLEISGSGLGVVQERMSDRVSFDAYGHWRYRYNFVNQRRIAIFGGGHCGVELACLMSGLGYVVTVIEPRRDLFTLERLPDSVKLVQADFAQGAAGVSYPEKTLVAVMTYSMPTDIEALSGILKCEFPWVGLMGSAPKISRIRKSLSEMGFSDLQLERLHAPIGLSFNSDTPQEIAVSIAAQILLDRESSNGYG